MNTQRAIGITLLVVGVVLLIIGMMSSDSFADQLSKTFTGRWTESTTWYIIGGIALGVLGIALTALTGGGKARA